MVEKIQVGVVFIAIDESHPRQQRLGVCGSVETRSSDTDEKGVGSKERAHGSSAEAAWWLGGSEYAGCGVEISPLKDSSYCMKCILLQDTLEHSSVGCLLFPIVMF
jgi:hypothetical protein